MRSLIAALFKGLICTVCFAFAAVLVLHFAGIKTDIGWSAGDRGKNIISVAADGNGNTDIRIGEKNIKIRQSDIESLGERLSDLIR